MKLERESNEKKYDKIVKRESSERKLSKKQ